jgi:hypothetical protein
MAVPPEDALSGFDTMPRPVASSKLGHAYSKGVVETVSAFTTSTMRSQPATVKPLRSGFAPSVVPVNF